MVLLVLYRLGCRGFLQDQLVLGLQKVLGYQANLLVLMVLLLQMVLLVQDCHSVHRFLEDQPAPRVLLVLGVLDSPEPH